MRLLVVAHPDDEAIFFGGLVQKFPNDFHIVCATDGNADGRGQERKSEFEKSCRALGADSFEMWDFPDIYEKRLDMAKLVEKIKSLASPTLTEIYTHGPLGEYGHPHHQDVCYGVYQSFEGEKILTPAYNALPTEMVQLTHGEFETKARILSQIYGKETEKFLNILPISFIEGFLEVSAREVEGIYQFLSKESKDLKNLDSFAHMENFIKTRLLDQKRLF